MKKRFELGKYYQHNSGSQLHICGICDTVYHGICFIGEEGWNRVMLLARIREMEEEAKRGGKIIHGGLDRRELIPISMSEDAMVNYFEITEEEFLKNNTVN